MSRKLLWFPSQKHVFCCQMQRPGTTPWATLGLRANAPYEERLEGISAGIGVLAPGPFWRVQIARFQDEWVFLQLEIVRQASMKSLKMICVIKKSLTNGIVCCFSCQRSLNVLQKKTWREMILQTYRQKKWLCWKNPKYKRLCLKIWYPQFPQIIIIILPIKTGHLEAIYLLFTPKSHQNTSIGGYIPHFQTPRNLMTNTQHLYFFAVQFPRLCRTLALCGS